MNAQRSTLNISFSILLFLLSINTYSQVAVNVCDGFTAVTRTGSTTFIPRAAPPYLNSNGKFYGPGLFILIPDVSLTDPAILAAIRYAESIADQMLATSSNTVPITMSVNHQSLNDLGLCQAFPVFSSYDFTSSNPLFIPNSVYPEALANKIANYNIFPNNNEASIFMNINTSWYYGTNGTPSTNQYDYVSVLLHEVCHGLGFAISNYPKASNSYGYTWDSQYFISLLDRFSINNSGVLLTSLTSPSASVQDYFQGLDIQASEGIYFNGPIAIYQNNSIKPRMQKNNRTHLHEQTYLLRNSNSLMTPELSNGEGIHDLGPIGKGILKDLGWDITIATGINDRLYITPCTNIWYLNFNSPDCNQYATVLNEGGTYSYLAHFEDNPPYGATMNTRNWKIELYKSDGSMYTLYNVTNSNITSETKSILVPSIPQITNNTWRRNDDGTIKAKLTVYGTDNQGYFKSSSTIVGINKKPDKPIVHLYSNTCGKPWSTNSASISFYAPGATSYKVYVGTTPGVYTTTYNVASGKFTYLVGLLGTGTYYISVKGFNVNDSSSIFGNELVVNTSCTANSRIASSDDDKQELSNNKITTFTDNKFLFIKNINSTQKCNLAILNTSGQIIKFKEITANEQNSALDISDLYDGLYIINLTDGMGIIYNSKFVINNK